jgi:hypothetical protein
MPDKFEQDLEDRGVREADYLGPEDELFPTGIRPEVVQAWRDYIAAMRHYAETCMKVGKPDA